jgi:hypothetical protein
MNLVADELSGELFFTESTTRKVRTVGYGGGGLTTLFEGSTGHTPYDLALCSGAADVGTTTTSSTTTSSTTPAPTTTSTTTSTTTTSTTTSTTTTTCPPDTAEISGGRDQIAVDQHQGGTYYPFIDPSDNLEYLIADLYLYVVDDLCDSYQLPLRVSLVECYGQDLVISDDLGTVVFDTRAATLQRQVAWGNTLEVLEWTDSSDNILRVVLFVGWDPNVEVLSWSQSFEPTDGRLDPRTIQNAVPSVRQLTVNTQDLSGVEQDIVVDVSNGIILEGGYNVDLDVTSEETEDGEIISHEIEVDAQAGNGIGRYPGCTEQEAIRQINDSEADSRGNFAFDALGCYRAQPVVASVDNSPTGTTFGQVSLQPGQLRVTNDCGPCCTCDDFIRVYEGVRRVWLKYKELGRRAELVRDQLALNLQRWEDNRDCRAGTNARCVLLPVFSCRAAAGAGVCNNTDGPLYGVELEIAFTGGTTTGGCVVCSSTMRRNNVDPEDDTPAGIWKPYQLIGDFPVFRARFDCIHPGEVGTVVFQMDFPGAGDGDNVCMRVSTKSGTPTQSVSECCTGLVCSGSEDCCEVGGTDPIDPPPEEDPVGEDGDIDRIYRNFATGTTVLSLSSATPHTLSPGDEVEVTGSSVDGYNTTHKILQTPSDVMLITDVTYTEDATGGRYAKV